MAICSHPCPSFLAASGYRVRRESLYPNRLPGPRQEMQKECHNDSAPLPGRCFAVRMGSATDTRGAVAAGPMGPRSREPAQSIARRIKLPFVPPNPNELERTVRTLASRATLGV